MNSYKDERLDFIDSLKGVAAIGVFLCHWSCSFIPGLYFDDRSNTLYETVWRGSLLNILTNGNIGVQMFFVFSGFLITRRVFENRIDKGSYILKKYISLVKVVVPAVTFSFILMKLGLYFNQDVVILDDGYYRFLSEYSSFDPTIKSYLLDIIKTFFRGSEYNGPLWTISHELLGTVYITFVSNYAFYIESAGKRKLTYILSIIPLIFYDMEVCAFVFGGLAYDCYQGLEVDNSGIGRLILKISYNQYSKIGIFVIGLYMACITNRPLIGMWKALEGRVIGIDLIRAMGVAIVLYCILLSDRIKKVLSKKILTRLGKVSTYIYSFHWPIILSMGCYIYSRIFVVSDGMQVFSALVTLSICLCITLLVATIYSDVVRKIKCIYQKIRGGELEIVDFFKGIEIIMYKSSENG